MAMCEKCTKSGYTPRQMFVDGDQFLGPCCATNLSAPVQRAPAQVLPFQPRQEDLEYGIEVSNKVGVHAYVNYQGLQLSFERSPTQLKAWAERQGLIMNSGT